MRIFIYTLICLFSLAAFMLVVPAPATIPENSDSSKTFGSFTESQRYIDTAGSSFYAGTTSRNIFKTCPEFYSTISILHDFYSGPKIDYLPVFTSVVIPGNIIACELLDLPPPVFPV